MSASVKTVALACGLVAVGLGTGVALRFATRPAAQLCPPCPARPSDCARPAVASPGEGAPARGAGTGKGISRSQKGEADERDRLVEEKAQLEAKAVLQGHLLAGAEAELNGEPIDWPARPDLKYTREGILAIVERAIAEQDLPVEIVGVDCSEFPCMLALATTARLANTDDLVSAPAWREAFPGHFAVDYLRDFQEHQCPGGRTVRALALAPFEAAFASGNTDSRLQVRRRQLLASSACSAPLASGQ